jgi:hypothetical protein
MFCRFGSSFAPSRSDPDCHSDRSKRSGGPRSRSSLRGPKISQSPSRRQTAQYNDGCETARHRFSIGRHSRGAAHLVFRSVPRYAPTRFKVGFPIHWTNCTTSVVGYLGPTIRAPLPSRLGSGIAQAWNIIEGEYSGRRLFIFDGLSGGYSSQPRTQIACETEQNPFPLTTSIETVSQIRGWTVLDGVWFLWFSWLMSIKRLERHLRYLSE